MSAIASGICHHLSNACRAVTPRGQVELIRLADQLNHAIQVGVVDGPDVAEHLERCEVVVERVVGDFRLATAALRVVLLHAHAILARDVNGLEPQTAVEGANVFGGVLRYVDDPDFGESLANLLALGGVVVDEHEAVESEAAASSQFA